jgi:hypothetical protein
MPPWTESQRAGLRHQIVIVSHWTRSRGSRVADEWAIDQDREQERRATDGFPCMVRPALDHDLTGREHRLGAFENELHAAL